MNLERFHVTYHILGDEDAAVQKAQTICLEQTIELGDELVPDGMIRDHIIGQIEQISPLNDNLKAVTISYLAETTAFDLTQLLNLVFGNTSIKNGIRVEDISLNKTLLKAFTGPRYGISGIRDIVGQYDKPLLCAALKPMGLSASEIAHLAYQFALGGVDIIKDDHGLTNQSFCPYDKRVEACVEAVKKANQETGLKCVYAPNVTASAAKIMDRVYFAKNAGAGALLISPGIVGFDFMLSIAADDQVNLPIISHPSLLGSMVIEKSMGFSHALLLGKIQRIAGADASVFPNYGGRFGFSKDECGSIARACRGIIGDYSAIFPTPGGGMTSDKAADMLEFYGNEVMFLIGGGLYGGSSGITSNVHSFLKLIGR